MRRHRWHQHTQQWTHTHTLSCFPAASFVRAHTAVYRGVRLSPSPLDSPPPSPPPGFSVQLEERWKVNIFISPCSCRWGRALGEDGRWRMAVVGVCVSVQSPLTLQTVGVKPGCLRAAHHSEDWSWISRWFSQTQSTNLKEVEVSVQWFGRPSSDQWHMTQPVNSQNGN